MPVARRSRVSLAQLSVVHLDQDSVESTSNKSQHNTSCSYCRNPSHSP